MNKATVYVETTIPSYLVAEPSRDIVVAAHQQTTRDWWHTAAEQFELVISELVYEELSHGRTDLVAKRLELVGGLTLLSANARVDELVGKYCRELGLTGRTSADVPHLAYCVAYEIDYLVTWNCAHLANGRVVRRLAMSIHWRTCRFQSSVRQMS